MSHQRRQRVRLFLEVLESRVALSTLTTSSNWAGYAVETNLDAPAAGAVSAVHGNWIVPAVRGRGTAFASVWVGIDGYDSGTVEQIGTDSDIINGQPVYYAWYEMYPRPSVTINNLHIAPGDHIAASVLYMSGVFVLGLNNQTTGQSFSVTRTMPGAQRSSAEWIVEAPSSSGGGILPLANFGTVTISNATATVEGVTGPIDSPTNDDAAINLVGRRRTQAVTSPLTDMGDASSFQVTFVSSTGGPVHRRRIVRDSNQTTQFASLTALPPAAVIVPPIDVTQVTATPLTRIVAPLTSGNAPALASPRITDIGYSTEGLVENDGEGAAAGPNASPNGRRAPAVERNQTPPAVAPQAPAVPPQELPPMQSNEVVLPNEQALSALFAEMAAADEAPEAAPADFASPMRLAALASVLLFAATPLLTVPERQQSKRLALSA